jgi:hypothetical protein
MLQVLTLFIIPIGGGIPAGVLLARAHGLTFAVTSGLYLFSDVLLALAFEPLILVAFGVDPMTGRAAAAAAGHGFVSGWAIAIAGDMLYFWVVMAATLKLSAYLGDPYRAMWIILAAMFLLPVLIRRVKAGVNARRAAKAAASV